MKTEMNNLVSIIWEDVEKLELLEKYINDSVNATLDYEKINFPCAVEVLIVTEESIREINNEYRNIDNVTDVLSFPLFDSIDEIDDFCMEDETHLGNVVICLQRAKEQAAEYGHSLEREICFLTVHSILHLLGYDHELGEREESEMFSKQREVLEIMGVRR